MKRAVLGATCFVLVSLVGAARAADPAKAPPAELKIRGYGFFGDLRLKRTIELLEFQKKKPPFFDANFIEDSALILRSKLREDGHLEAEIVADITLENGRTLQHAWNGSVEEPLSRPLRARAVRFNIRPGLLYHYARIAFEGLNVISPKHAREFFIETSGLFPLKKNRVYSPARLKRSVSNLQEALSRLGYNNAMVTVTNLNRDARAGAVRVRLEVREGRKFMVRSVRQEIYFGDTNAPPAKTLTNILSRVYSRFWEQDYIQDVKTNYYHQGYPETSVTLQTAESAVTNGVVVLDLTAVVNTGPRVRVGEVIFRGDKRTRPSLLRRRVALKPGEWLDRVKAEQGQYRLSRLGVFDSVQLNYEPESTNVWNPVYDLKEGKRVDVSLISGFGSYDLVRGGVEISQHNLWGLAHNQRLQLVQSFKSSSGDYTYTIPELLGEDADVFVAGSGLRRKEISFTRLEYGGGAGVRKCFPGINTDTTLRYNYGILEATAASINFAQVGAQSPLVGEIIGDFNHDRRDNPLNPSKGYQVLGNIEIASQALGGEVDFQRIELAASCHLPLNSSEWIHLGLRHGVVATLGGTSQDLPFARRFFPGGENSVRGYQEGEAAPRDAQGNIVGAETYTTGNVEFEQALTPRWSLVAFVDGVGFARKLGHYPEDQALFSAGGGIRWKTIVGPVRVEYGYNLNPRPGDPSGTLQFALGFPF